MALIRTRWRVAINISSIVRQFVKCDCELKKTNAITSFFVCRKRLMSPQSFIARSEHSSHRFQQVYSMYSFIFLCFSNYKPIDALFAAAFCSFILPFDFFTEDVIKHTIEKSTLLFFMIYIQCEETCIVVVACILCTKRVFQLNSKVQVTMKLCKLNAKQSGCLGI